MTMPANPSPEQVERLRKVAEGGTINGTYQQTPMTALQSFRNDLADLISAHRAASRAGEENEVDCERCQGNGEIVTDWDRYLHAKPDDKGDEAVADCPDCSGTGRLSPTGELAARGKFTVEDEEDGFVGLNVTIGDNVYIEQRNPEGGEPSLIVLGQRQFQALAALSRHRGGGA